MQFNVDKCVVMYMGRKNKEADYMLENKKINKFDRERDLGIIVDSKYKFSDQCNEAVKSAKCTLGMIKRNITYKSKDGIVRIYKALVRSKLE